jgi:predicted nucleic acid-binding protein
MVIEDFFSKSVFLDTAPLIYYMEGHSPYQKSLTELFKFNDQGNFAFVTSSITLLETLVKPLRDNKPDLARQYKDILTKAVGIEMLDVTGIVAEKAAQLRAKYSLRTPDAIQLPAAMESNCDYFLTHDKSLKSITEIMVITLEDIQ